MSKNMKNLYICNNFFKHVIDAYVIILIMKTVNGKDINKFWSWIAQSN